MGLRTALARFRVVLLCGGVLALVALSVGIFNGTRERIYGQDDSPGDYHGILRHLQARVPGLEEAPTMPPYMVAQQLPMNTSGQTKPAGPQAQMVDQEPADVMQPAVASAQGMQRIPVNLNEGNHGPGAPGMVPLACALLSPILQKLNSLQWPRKPVNAAPKIARIVYLNMDQDTTRRQDFEQEMSGFHQRGSFFDVWHWKAVDVNKARFDSWFKAFRRDGFNPIHPYSLRGMEANQYATFLSYQEADLPEHEKQRWSVAATMFSHYAILQEMAKHTQNLVSSNEVWFIVEDSAILAENLEKIWLQLWNYLPDEWDILRLGPQEGNPPAHCETFINGHLELAVRDWDVKESACYDCGLMAYIVNPKSLHKVLWRIMHAKIYHIDSLLSAPTPPHEDPDVVPPLRAFNVHPKLVTKRVYVASPVPRQASAPVQGSGTKAGASSQAAKPATQVTQITH